MYLHAYLYDFCRLPPVAGCACRNRARYEYDNNCQQIPVRAVFARGQLAVLILYPVDRVGVAVRLSVCVSHMTPASCQNGSTRKQRCAFQFLNIQTI